MDAYDFDQHLLKQKTVIVIEFDPDYDEYGGAFTVTCNNEKSEELLTADEAFDFARTMLELSQI